MMVRLKHFLLLSLILSVTQTFAADRALLIGVGEYQLKKNNLPGIDLDLAMMQQASRLMGFEQIKVLKNEQATFNNVVNTIHSFLINGVSKEDRVLLYYSGHGAQVRDVNGDEHDDGVDELLTMHDMAVNKNDAGQVFISNILVDDELHALLKRIPSENLLVLVDACHSGTSTRSMRIRHSILGDDVQVKPKFIQFEGMPEVSRGISLKTTPSTRLSNDIPFVSLAAAGDLETSIATSKGSLFTLGVLSAVKNAAQNEQVLTPKLLRQQVAAFIKNEKQTFTPRLSGNTRLANKALKLKPAKEDAGSNWQRFVELGRKWSQLKILTNQKNYRLGDALKFKVVNDQPGYLNVVNVDANDRATILYPNKFHPDALVQGTVTIPSEVMGFDLVTQKPLGRSLIVAFLSSEPFNLYKEGLASRSSKGVLETVFHQVSEKGLAEAEKLTEKAGAQTSWVKSGGFITRISE